MRTRPSSLPVLIQVAALAALAIVASQAVAFALVLFAPEPRPAGFSVQAAVAALKGEPAETSDGRALRRRIGGDEPLALQPERGEAHHGGRGDAALQCTAR